MFTDAFAYGCIPLGIADLVPYVDDKVCVRYTAGHNASGGRDPTPDGVKLIVFTIKYPVKRSLELNAFLSQKIYTVVDA